MTGFESGDPNLHDKIAKLKQKRQSGKDRVNEFLEKELHLDPRDLPFTLDAANARMKEIMDGNGFGDRVDFANMQGNSLGLKAVFFRSNDLPLPPQGCPACGDTTSGGYWDNVSTSGDVRQGEWVCYSCDERSLVPLTPDTTIKTVTHNDHGGEDWHDLTRCWVAFRDHVKVLNPSEEQVTCYSFVVSKTWNSAQAEAIVPPAPEPDIATYPTGATLRIQKATFNAGDVDVEHVYVRVGGLFNDTDVVDLNTMKPIEDLSGWTVSEEL
jgi:hypothetical protein